MNALSVVRSASLVSPVAAGVIAAMLVAGAVFSAWRAPSSRTWCSVAVALVVAGIAAFALNVWPKPFPDDIPVTVYAAWAVAVFVLCQSVGALWSRFRRSARRAPQEGRSLWRGVALVGVSVASISAAYLATNLVYQEYPTVGSLQPVPVSVQMTADEFRASTVPPTLNGREVGALVTLDAAPMRDAVAYVPPAYWKGTQLPVLVILSGNPGSPMQWYTDGQADEALDNFQLKHDGVAPLTISADATGSETGNPGCVDGPEFKVQSYLTQAIPQLVTSMFHVNQDRSTWTIGGLSYGGTCALQVATNHPDAYGSFLDFSGEPEPSTGNHDKTVNELFGGDEAAFQAQNPATLLADATGTDKYAHLAGLFISGERDQMSTAALPHLNDLAKAAGMETKYSTVPGGHNYAVWRTALRESMDFVAQRGGIR